MRIVGEYLATAAVYEAMAASEAEPRLKADYSDLAAYYANLAQQRRWQLTTKAMNGFAAKIVVGGGIGTRPQAHQTSG